MPGLLDMLSQTWPAKLAQGAWSGITAPRDAYQGKLDPLSPEGIARANSLAGLVMGGTYGTAPAGALGSGAVKPIRAYHGSPHDFERFDMSKIGTGEGAQAYGHGLYFAENPAVARDYRNNLSRGRLMEGASIKLDPDVGYVATKPTGERQVFSFEKEAKEWIENPGKMYEVNINARPEQFINYDKPLTAQSADVMAGLNRLGIEETGGQSLPNFLAEHFGGSARSSQALGEAGIPGIKYLDQGSRFSGTQSVPHLESQIAQLQEKLKAGGGADIERALAGRQQELANAQKGTSNYVLFRDDIIDIVKKYGWAGLAAMGIDPSNLPIPQQQAPVFPAAETK